MSKSKTKSQRRRERAAHRPSKPADSHAPANDASARPDKPTSRPTPERWQRGIWREASGAGKEARPLVDAASDLIGRLYAENKLTSSQHEAARRFQEVREAFMAELGTVGYRSCLADGSGGHDSGDGDPDVARAYRALSARLGPHLRVLVDNVHKLGDENVTDINALRAALGVLAGDKNNG